MKTYLAILALILGIFAAGFAAGWAFRGVDQPIGGIPTVNAVNQMAVEIEADQTATTPATEPAPTSTAAPTRQQPTSKPTATATPEREVWELDCTNTEGLVKCHEIVVSEDGEVARLYWVGPCLYPGTLRLQKQIAGQLYVDLQDDEWDYKFMPNKCDRPADRPSRNYLLVRTYDGPGNYALIFEPLGVNVEYVEFFEWLNAPEATVPTPTAVTTLLTPITTSDLPAGTMAYTPTPTPTRSPYHYGPNNCSYSAQLGLFLWTDSIQGRRWSLWDTVGFGDGGYLVLAFHEPAGEVRWLVGDETDPCINMGQLAGQAGLEKYLATIGREDIVIPSPPEVGD